MFFYDPQDTSNSIAIKPLTPPELKIIKVVDDSCASISTNIDAGKQYTYVSSLKGNDSTQLKWCFWIDKQDEKFEEDYTIQIDATEKEEATTDFFLTSKVEGDNEKKKENTELLQENAILSATITTETHDIDGKQQEVAVLKVKFSKWLDGEKVRVEVYKYNEKNKKPTRDASKNAVCSRTVIANPEVAEVYWMSADGEKLEETGYSEDIYLYIKTLGLKDKTLELNIFDDDITPEPIVMQNEDDYVSWTGNKIKVEKRDSIKQFKVGSKERYKDAQKDEVEDEKPKENDFLQTYIDFNTINDSKKKQDPEILELYVCINNATELKLNSAQTKFGKLKLTPKEQVVDAFFSKADIDEAAKMEELISGEPKTEVLKDAALSKGKNQKETVSHYEKLNRGIIGQKIKIIAECDNLNDKEVTFELFEKSELLTQKDKAISVIQDDKAVEKITATVKDGYAVAEFNFQKVDSTTYKAWDTKLNPTTGETEISELYIKTTCTTLQHPGTVKNFLKEDKKYFNLKGLIEQHIYHNGEISKEEYDQAQKVKFIYHDKTDNEHNLGTFEITWTQAWLRGVNKKSKNYERLVANNLKAWKKEVSGTTTTYYLYDGKHKAPLVTPYNGNTTYSYKENGVVIVMSESTSREFHNPVGLATIFGALAEVKYEDVVSNGSVASDGHGAPSVSHINGFNADFKYLRKDKKRGSIDVGISPIYVNNSELDVTRQNDFLEALHKFGWGTTKNNLSHYIDATKKTLLKYCQKDDFHKDHLHIQGFKPNYRKL